MAHLMVIDVEEQTRVPYLRGILTRSLQNAGLTFEQSYELANTIRDELGEASEITNVELGRRVQTHLEQEYREAAARYAGRGGAVEAISIESADGEHRPYSRGRHRLDLMSSGLSSDDAVSIGSAVYRELVERGQLQIQADELCELTYRLIERELGEGDAERYLVRQRYLASDRPLLVLVGGTVGTGKSTVSTALAHRLGIVRIQSTDMLREVMRAMIPRRLLPVLYKSTYTAWQALPGPAAHDEPDDHLLAEGYLSQAEPVSLAYEAVVKRALKERLSLILEGVHMHPGWLSRLPQDGDVIIVPIMLAVLSRKQLKKRIKGRGRRERDRRSERYLANLDTIWQLQSFLLSEADEVGVPIVFNEDLESTVQQALGLVLDVLATHYSGVAEPAR